MSLNPSLPLLDFIQLEKRTCNSRWEWAVLIWEALPTTALTSVTFSPALKTARNLVMWERGENRFQDLGWQGYKLLRPSEFCSKRPAVIAELTPPFSRDSLPTGTCVLSFRTVSDHDGIPTCSHAIFFP